MNSLVTHSEKNDTEESKYIYDKGDNVYNKRETRDKIWIFTKITVLSQFFLLCVPSELTLFYIKVLFKRKPDIKNRLGINVATCFRAKEATKEMGYVVMNWFKYER